MNRRTAMFLSLLLGGILPRGLFAQDQKTRRVADRTGAAKKPRAKLADEEDSGLDPKEADSDATPNMPPQAGFGWKTWDIKRYTSTHLPHTATHPQQAILDWVFRRTTDAVWHGEKLACLGATRTQLRAYHDSETLKMVDEVVERFVQAEEDVLSIHIRIIRTDNVRWRYPVYSVLQFRESGAQGQQVWELETNQAAQVLAQLQLQGHKLLVDRAVEMINGQTLKIETFVNRGYIAGTQRASNAALGPQGRSDQLREGVWLHVSPLLTYDTDAVDVYLDLTTNTVRSFHRSKVIAPREIGPNEVNVDIPEVSQTYLKITTKALKLGKTLVISAGIQPGILDDNKNGFLNLRLPGTVPTGSELLVFIDLGVVKKSRKEEVKDDER